MPGKAVYKDFEADEDLEFSFYLADRLKMTVEEMHERMTNLEFLQWKVFHSRKAQREQLAAKG